jgi:hypothetical protein
MEGSEFKKRGRSLAILKTFGVHLAYSVLRYKSEGRWLDPRWCHGISH